MSDNHNLTNNENSSCKCFYKEEVKQTKKSTKILKCFIPFLSISLSLVFGLIISFSYFFLKDVAIPEYANKSVLVNNLEDSNVLKINDYNDLVKAVIKTTEPSIVSITSLGINSDFYNIPIQTEGSGSGIIFHKTPTDVFIVTNHHVIKDAQSVGIVIGDSSPIPAKLIGKDENYDLAVVSVSYSDLLDEGIDDIVVAKFADNSSIAVGDYSIAIGNALDQGITSTFGIISSVSTNITTKQGTLLNVLQTTSAINPGNSGGALINLQGEVVGINTAKMSNTEIEGIGYTISSSVAIPIIENIMNNTQPASLGIKITEATQVDDIIGGALIVEILPNGSAHRAGLKIEDIITSINGTPVLNPSQLIEELKNFSIGDTVTLKIIRNGKVQPIKVKLLPTQNSRTSF